MAVDEDTLDSTIVDLAEKLNENSIKRQKLKDLYTCASEIALVDVPDSTIEDPNQTKKVLPLDDELGVEITVDRREQIYNNLMSSVSEL